jgi:hypothetical protein
MINPLGQLIMATHKLSLLVLATLWLVPAPVGLGDDIKKTEVYARLKQVLDAVPAIDTHEHLRSFDELPNRVTTPEGEGITLHSIWAGSYFVWTNPLSPWPADAVLHDGASG